MSRAAPRGPPGSGCPARRGSGRARRGSPGRSGRARRAGRPGAARLAVARAARAVPPTARPGSGRRPGCARSAGRPARSPGARTACRALAERQPADLDREYPRAGHRQGCRQVAVPPAAIAATNPKTIMAGRRRRRRPRPVATAITPRSTGVPSRDIAPRRGASSSAQASRARPSTAYPRPEPGRRPARRRAEERQQAEPGEAEGAGQRVDRRSMTPVSAGRGAGRQPVG